MEKNLLALLFVLLATIAVVFGCIPTPPENASDEWEIIKQYVTTNYPISEKYFDEHFKFSSIRTIYLKSNKFDYRQNTFPILLENVIEVKFKFLITDNEGVTHEFGDYGIYLTDGKIIDSTNKPADLSNQFAYDLARPTKELQIILTKQQAIDIAKAHEQCSNTEKLDIQKAEENTGLLFRGSYLVWNWTDSGVHCEINTETGEIDYYFGLPD